MTRSMRRDRTWSSRWVSAVAIAGSLAVGGLATAAPFLVFMRDGSIRTLDVTSIDERGITGVDMDAMRAAEQATASDGVIADPEPELIPLATALALVQWSDAGTMPPSAARPDVRRTGGRIMLRSGERIPGSLIVEPGPPGETFTWRHRRFGSFEISLDDLDSMIPRTSRDPGPVELDGGDRVVLANGDLIDGFIAAIGSVVEVEREGDDGDLSILEMPIERVAAIRLVAGERDEPKPTRAWFTDGTVLDLTAISVDEDAGLEMASPRIEAKVSLFGLRELAALVLDTRRLISLAGLEIVSVEPIGPRHHAPEPQALEPFAGAMLGPIELAGPVAVTWDLPDGARRFAAEAVLPEQARAWGDLDLVILDGREERMRQRIDGDNPAVLIDVPLSGVERRLTIRLEPGRWGPVMDRIELRVPRVLVD